MSLADWNDEPGRTADKVAAMLRKAAEGYGGRQPPLMLAMHVTPVDDLMEHNHSTAQCWCEPRVFFKDDTYVIIHRCADRRERHEGQN